MISNDLCQDTEDYEIMVDIGPVNEVITRILRFENGGL